MDTYTPAVKTDIRQTFARIRGEPGIASTPAAPPCSSPCAELRRLRKLRAELDRIMHLGQHGAVMYCTIADYEQMLRDADGVR